MFTYLKIINMFTYSENMKLLNKEIQRLKKIEKDKKKSSILQNTIVSKRKSKQNKIWSFDYPNTSTKVKMNKKIKKVLIIMLVIII